ncbi:MAG: arsenosugar biosynthesis radical SAM (seleno)protein ArsS [Planctomycetota bacterium]|jgi:radical SAM/Cys-rich protein
MLLKQAGRFEQALAEHGLPAPTRRATVTLQVNLGKLCNQACHHCHVDAGPSRVERMDERTAERVLHVLRDNPDVRTLDITGGAPELNPHFRRLVEGAREAGRDVIVRCNLTVLQLPGQADTAAFYAKHRVTVVASLPCYTADNTDSQRGDGVFDLSMAALRRLNALGYGASQGEPDDDALRLNLVYNPLGPFLPPPQEALQADYRARLAADHGVVFDRLFTITNMPIHRFAEDLAARGTLDAYQQLLGESFNPDSVEGLMCRDLLSVDWDGRLSDCDFNQMLDLPLGADPGPKPATIFELDDLSALTGARVTVADHCLGCTAGQGSSCGGALQPSDGL